MGLAAAMGRHKRLLAAAAVAVVAAVAFVLWWFQPQKLLIDERMSEPVPVAAGPAPGGGAGDPAAAPATIAGGDLRSLSHTSSGRVLVLALPDGARVLRFEGLKTDNGPDLRVYLSTAPATGPGSGFDDDFVDLGRLKGNLGDQNYDLPPEIDLARYQSAVIWCRRFSVGFAVAPLGA